MSKEVMNVQEVAAYLGLGVAKVYQLVEHKEIPASKIGKQYRFLRNVINAWLGSNIIMKDTAFLTLIQDVKKDFRDAGYTQKDVDETVAEVKKQA